MQITFIIVAGGSASGKTTVVEKIKSSFSKEEVTVITQDNYYNDQSHLTIDERKNTNYDHPDAIDSKLLLTHIKMILDNKSINIPEYDFYTSNRKNKTTKTNPTKIVIFEGIFALYFKEILDLASIKIFVECDDDIRFIRRLKRDVNERGRSIDHVIHQYLSTVKPMYESYVAPTKRNADIIIPNYNQHDVAIDIIFAKIKEILNK